MLYRATIWYLNACVEDHDGYAGVKRYVVEHEADSVEQFKGMVMDAAMRSVDDSVEFGPVSEKPVRRRK